MSYENKQDSEHLNEGTSVLERLTCPEVLTSLRERHQAVVDTFADNVIIKAREDDLTNALREKLLEEDTDNSEEIRVIKGQLHTLSHGSTHDRHYAVACLYEMERHPGNYYDMMGNPENEPILERLALPTDESEFVTAEKFKGLYDESEPVVYLLADDSRGYMIPTSNIISAEGFESWGGRATSHNKSGNRISAEVIAEYAQLSPDEAPGVYLTGVERANGSVVYMVSDGTHRVAAAKLRGDETVRVSEIILRKERRGL